MKDGSLKYIVIIIISFITIIVLSFYIMDFEKQMKSEEKSTNVIKEKKDKVTKEYLFTRKLSIREDEKEYTINLKYYGELLNNKQKVISTEIYFDEIIKGEYIYVAPIESELDYKEIINTYEKKQIDKKNELYLINNYLILSLFRYEDNINNTLIMFDKEGTKIDEYNHKYIKNCSIELNEQKIEDVIFDNEQFYFFEKKDKEIENYSLIINDEGFIKNKIGQYSYEEYCKQGG